MNKRLKKSGFTLVELLVVIGIIAMLAGIIVPVLNRARENARTVSCVSNLKGLGTCLSTYVHENGDFLPPCNSGPGGQWYYTLLPYVENNWEIFQCTSMMPANDVPEVFADEDEEDSEGDSEGAPTETLHSVHYGMNYQLTGVDADMTANIQLTSFVNPAQALYLADGALFSALKEGVDEIMVPDMDTMLPDSVIDGAIHFPESGNELPEDKPVIAPRHLGGVNCLFLDNSVRKYSAEDLLRAARGSRGCLYEAKVYGGE